MYSTLSVTSYDLLKNKTWDLILEIIALIYSLKNAVAKTVDCSKLENHGYGF